MKDITQEEFYHGTDENEYDNPVNHCPDCTKPLLLRTEQRDNGQSEKIAYCSQCGYTAT